MEITALFRDEQAVSPVIGVVLLVGISSLAMAITGVLILSGDIYTDSPNANFDFEFHDGSNIAGPDEVLITHAGGDSIAHDELIISATTPIKDEAGNLAPQEEYTWGQIEANDGINDGDESDGSADPGDVAAIEPEDTEQMEGETIRLFYDSGGGSRTLVGSYSA